MTYILVFMHPASSYTLSKEAGPITPSSPHLYLRCPDKLTHGPWRTPITKTWRWTVRVLVHHGGYQDSPLSSLVQYLQKDPLPAGSTARSLSVLMKMEFTLHGFYLRYIHPTASLNLIFLECENYASGDKSTWFTACQDVSLDVCQFIEARQREALMLPDSFRLHGQIFSFTSHRESELLKIYAFIASVSLLCQTSQLHQSMLDILPICSGWECDVETLKLIRSLTVVVSLWRRGRD